MSAPARPTPGRAAPESDAKQVPRRPRRARGPWRRPSNPDRRSRTGTTGATGPLRSRRARVPRLLVPDRVGAPGRPQADADHRCGREDRPGPRGRHVHGLHDRCPHRGVPLSLGRRQFPGTISCPYHGWTYGLDDGQLCAVITDGPDSPICGKVSVAHLPGRGAHGAACGSTSGRSPRARTAARRARHPGRADRQRVRAGRAHRGLRDGNWRFAAENGFDEGHAKYLHNTALWRLFKVMPTWNKTRIVEQDGVADPRRRTRSTGTPSSPGSARLTNKRWWKRMPLPDAPGQGRRRQPA